MSIVSQQTLHDTIFCTGAAVNIITMGDPAGHAGFTANVAYSVTDAPPTLLVYLNHGASVWPVFDENRALCVDTLGTGQESFSNLFGGKTPMEHHFAAARWQTGVARCPQLEEALISFDCRISQVVSVGTHDILFCAIEAIHHHTTPYGPVRFDRSYHALMRLAR